MRREDRRIDPGGRAPRQKMNEAIGLANQTLFGLLTPLTWAKALYPQQ